MSQDLIPIEFKRLPKNQPQGSKKLLPVGFLSIHRRDRFDSANPPWSIVSNHRRQHLHLQLEDFGRLMEPAIDAGWRARGWGRLLPADPGVMPCPPVMEQNGTGNSLNDAMRRPTSLAPDTLLLVDAQAGVLAV
jgi:hypothetical protein